MSLKVMTIVGTRPEIIKLSRVIAALDRHTKHLLVHTGQNYDYELNQVFFEQLQIRKPDHFLDAAGKTAAATIAAVIERADAVLERERLGSTGVGEGVAIPHARIESLSRPVAGFARLLEPADFEAIDERPADLIFMLLAPTDSGADHLRALARAARVFRQERIRTALRQAQTSEAVLAVLAPDAAIDAA